MKTKLLIILTTFAVAASRPKHTANPDQNAALMEPVKPMFQVHRDSRTAG